MSNKKNGVLFVGNGWECCPHPQLDGLVFKLTYEERTAAGVSEPKETEEFFIATSIAEIMISNLQNQLNAAKERKK